MGRALGASARVGVRGDRWVCGLSGEAPRGFTPGPPAARGAATSGHEKRGVLPWWGASVQRWSGSVWCYEPVLQGDLGRAEHQRVCHEHEDESSIERVSGRSSPS